MKHPRRRSKNILVEKKKQPFRALLSAIATNSSLARFQTRPRTFRRLSFELPTWTTAAAWLFVFLASAAPGAARAAEPAKDSAEPPFAEKPYPGKIVELKVEPSRLAIKDKFDFRRAIVLGKTPEGLWIDLSRVAQFSVPADIAARDDEGFFSPKKDGKGVVKIQAGGLSVDLPISVEGFESPRPISFIRDVMPILSKAECNSGPCHGTPKGKNGFKLSLRGYDPEWDHEQLVDDLSSRRFNRSRPRDSLMLLKPAQEVPHEGGFRFASDSHYYNVLLQWIVEGNKSDYGKATRATGIRVLPETLALSGPGAVQELVVLADYDDGSTRDVTREAVFSSSKDFVTKVAAGARVQGIRRGEAAVLVRYEGNYAVKYVSVLNDRPGFVWTETPANNYIDELVLKKLKETKTLPSELCTDEEFLRRVYLDVIGTAPSPEEVRAFLADATPTAEKRAKVIDELLERPGYVDRWAHKWADLLQCNRKYLGERGVWAFRNWIREAVANNMPIDKFVYELLTASGSTFENPATNYYRIARDPLHAMENATHLFLGIRFNCNKCHDHPFERWTQAQHYELGAFFSQVGRKPGVLPEEEIIFDRRDGGDPVSHPRTGAPMTARFPYEHGGSVDEPALKRRMVARWITAPENPYFARSIVNRFWSYFLGVGIIDPVDDIRSGNPPSNPELLDALTKDFVAHGFDLKHLIRTILRSRTYQQSIKTNDWNEDDDSNFSHAIPRRLTAEQLQDAISVALGVTIRYPGLPEGFRAVQLPDSQVQMEFLDQFGRPPRESVCECERVSEVSLRQALNLINGPTIGDALAHPEGRFAKLAATKPTAERMAEEVYLAVLCRMPNAEEKKQAAKYFAESASILEGAQDLAWALCNSPAFLFNR